jgi:hypothetical protein
VEVVLVKVLSGSRRFRVYGNRNPQIAFAAEKPRRALEDWFAQTTSRTHEQDKTNMAGSDNLVTIGPKRPDGPKGYEGSDPRACVEPPGTNRLHSEVEKAYLSC